MSRLDALKRFVQQRLTAAVDDIFGHFERTISEYEAELSRRHQQLRDAAAAAGEPPRAGDVQLQQQGWISGLDQEDADPPRIKEEQEELWTNQEGVRLEGLEDADVTKFTFSPVQDEEDKPLPSQIRRTQESGGAEPPSVKTEAAADDDSGSEPARTCLDPDPLLHPDPDDCGEPETDERSCLWSETRDARPLSGAAAEGAYASAAAAAAKSYSCSECGKRFGQKGTLQRHMNGHTGERLFSCPFCSRSFSQKVTLEQHMRIHTGEKPFSCPVCAKRFTQKGNLKYHMTVHTGEKPFSCGVCAKRFTRPSRVKKHKCVVEGGGGGQN